MPKPARVQTTEPSGLQGQFLQMQFLTEIRMSIGCGGIRANGQKWFENALKAPYPGRLQHSFPSGAVASKSVR